METNGWNEHKLHVNAELKRLSDKLEKIDEKLDTLHLSLSNEITSLKVRAGWIGRVVSLLVSGGAIIVKMFLGN